MVEEDSENKRRFTLKGVIAYIFAILMIMAALGGLIAGTITFAILYLAGGVIALPPARRWISNEQGIELSTGLTVVIVGILFIGGGVAASTGGSSSGAGEPAQTDPIDTQTPEPSGPAVDQSTPTSTPTERSTPTPTPTPVKETKHEVGESFVVGGGDKKLRYTVTDWKTLDSVGGEFTKTTPTGTYLVVVFEVKNVGKESVNLRSGMYKGIDSQDRTFSTDSEAMIAGSKDQLGAEPVSYDQINPGLSRNAAVVFDVGSGEYRMMFSPAGVFSGANDHFVTLGQVP